MRANTLGMHGMTKPPILEMAASDVDSNDMPVPIDHRRAAGVARHSGVTRGKCEHQCSKARFHYDGGVCTSLRFQRRSSYEPHWLADPWGGGCHSQRLDPRRKGVYLKRRKISLAKWLIFPGASASKRQHAACRGNLGEDPLLRKDVIKRHVRYDMGQFLSGVGGVVDRAVDSLALGEFVQHMQRREEQGSGRRKLIDQDSVGAQERLQADTEFRTDDATRDNCWRFNKVVRHQCPITILFRSTARKLPKDVSHIVNRETEEIRSRMFNFAENELTMARPAEVVVGACRACPAPESTTPYWLRATRVAPMPDMYEFGGVCSHWLSSTLRVANLMAGGNRQSPPSTTSDSVAATLAQRAA